MTDVPENGALSYPGNRVPAKSLDLSIIVNIVSTCLKTDVAVNYTIFDELLYYCIIFLQPIYRSYILSSLQYLERMCIYHIQIPLVTEASGLIKRAWKRHCKLKML